MERFLQWIERISALAAPPAVVVLVMALGLVLVTRRWLFRLVGMALVYFFVGVLHTQVIRPEVVLVKLLIGVVVCLALGVTGQAVGGIEATKVNNSGKPEKGVRFRWRNLLSWREDVPLRTFALFAALLIAYAGSLRFPLPQVPFLVGLSCYLLAMVGLFLAGMAETPLGVGMGLLVFLNGFDLFFGALEPSLVVAGLLGLIQFLVTFAAAYLTLARAE